MLSVSLPAHAFQETDIPVTAHSPANKAESSAVNSTDTNAANEENKLSLALPPLGDTKADNKTQIYIPGLGLFGGLPKFNFGLELLYSGSKDEPAPIQNNDLTIKGTIKHNF